MNYSIFLGPTNQAVPPESWDEFKSKNLLFLWDLVLRDHGGIGYKAWLERDKSRISVGVMLRSPGVTKCWLALPDDTTVPGVDGFATRLYAAEYMLNTQGYTRRP